MDMAHRAGHTARTVSMRGFDVCPLRTLTKVGKGTPEEAAKSARSAVGTRFRAARTCSADGIAAFMNPQCTASGIGSSTVPGWSVPEHWGMGRPDQLPELWRRLCALCGLPADSSIDAIHREVRVVGRGTLQRIREGVEGTSMRSLGLIADHFRIPMSSLMTDEPLRTAREPSESYAPKPEAVIEQLAALLDALDSSEQAAAAFALQSLVAAPDSVKARAALVRLLSRKPQLA